MNQNQNIDAQIQAYSFNPHMKFKPKAAGKTKQEVMKDYLMSSFDRWIDIAEWATNSTVAPFFIVSEESVKCELARIRNSPYCWFEQTKINKRMHYKYKQTSIEAELIKTGQRADLEVREHGLTKLMLAEASTTILNQNSIIKALSLKNTEFVEQIRLLQETR